MYDTLNEETRRALDKALGAIPHSMRAYELMEKRVPVRLSRLSERSLIARVMDHAGDGLGGGTMDELDRCLAALAAREALSMQVASTLRERRDEIAAHIW